VTGGADRGALSADIFQPPDSTTLEAKDQHGDVSRTKLPRPPSSKELSTAKVDAQIHKALDLGVNPNPGADLVPLQRWIASARVSTLGPILIVL
jgi:hypothetical protein